MKQYSFVKDGSAMHAGGMVRSTLLAFFLLTGLVQANEPRLWTNRDCETLNAQLVAYSDNFVALKAEDGSIVTWPTSKLDLNDQIYLQELPEKHMDSVAMQASTQPVKTQVSNEAFVERKTPRLRKSSRGLQSARKIQGARGLNGARGL